MKGDYDIDVGFKRGTIRIHRFRTPRAVKQIERDTALDCILIILVVGLLIALFGGKPW